MPSILDKLIKSSLVAFVGIMPCIQMLAYCPVHRCWHNALYTYDAH